MAEAGKLAGVADEGGWWPAFASNEEALEMLVRAIERAGLHPGDDVAISLDIAASEFGRDGRYTLGARRARARPRRHGEMLLRWLDRYPIAVDRGPVRRGRRDGWIAFTRAAGRACRSSATTTSTTNAARVDAAAADDACNAVLIKPNQAGTVTEARPRSTPARRAGFGTIVSARSGETEDVSIAHLAVGWNAGQLKVGSFARGERMAKWNEVLRIEEAARATHGVRRRWRAASAGGGEFAQAAGR